MNENVCCPLLGIASCHDTTEHNHLICEPHYAIEGSLMPNSYVAQVCLGDFKACPIHAINQAKLRREATERPLKGYETLPTISQGV